MGKSIFEQLKEEDALRESNQEANIREYGQKLAEISNEVDVLTATKSQLQKEIKELENGKSEIANKVLANAKRQEEEAKAILADAKNEEKALIASRKKLEKEIVSFNEYVEDQKAFIASENNKSNILKSEAKNIKEEANKGLKAAEDELWNARKFAKEAEVDKLLANTARIKVENLQLKLEKKEEELNAKIKANDSQSKELGILLQENKDLANKLAEDQDSFDEDRINSYNDLEEKKAKYEEDRKELLKLSQTNELRSVELDAGFSKLKELSKATDKEIKKLTQIREQLIKEK